MTRDELLLAALAAGATSTAGLMRATGVRERSCRYGLSRLIGAGYAWSPARGRWQLTEAGRAIAVTLPSVSAAERPDPESGARPPAEGGSATAAETTELAPPPGSPPGAPTSFWWTLAAIAAAVALALAQRSATAPPTPPATAPPTLWPYDGWRV